MIEEWPCFQFGEYLLEEMRLALAMNEKQVDMLHRRCSKMIDAILKIQDEETKCKSPKVRMD